jgi:hypothetical protein
MQNKRLTLNAEKRKTIENVFQSHWEREDSPVIQEWQDAKKTYDTMKPKVLELVNNVVRSHQPQEDVDTIRSMIKKYDRSGGELYHDNCFNFQTPTVNDQGEEDTDEIKIDFTLQPSLSGYHRSSAFARAYYREEMKAKGLNPDYDLQWKDEKRNPRYYDHESACDKWLGFSNSSNEDKSITKPVQAWKNDDSYKLWVIGTSYCHTRLFNVDSTTFEIFKMFRKSQEDIVRTHEKIFNYVDEKMKKLRLGLKSYRYFDQAKALADKLGIALNESILNESSSMALSVYSPENLASLLEDKVEMTREEKIAYFKAQQQSVN